MVHQFHRWKLGWHILAWRFAVGRQVLCRHGAGPRTRVLRLRHLRGQIAGARSPSRLDQTTLKYAQQVPKHDPVPLAAMVAAATSRIGVVATMSTLAWPPFMLARASSTIDHIAGGRFGWNIVTSGEDLAAQNFGMDVLPPRDTRYAMADEYMDLVNQLFDSWEPGAVLKDREHSIYADHTKVHPIHFEGQYFK